MNSVKENVFVSYKVDLTNGYFMYLQYKDKENVTVELYLKDKTDKNSLNKGTRLISKKYDKSNIGDLSFFADELIKIINSFYPYKK